MKRTILNIAVSLLRAIYAPHKLFPTKNRVLYLSRQRNSTTEEINLLLKRIQELDPSVEVHAITKKIPAGLLGKLGYCIHLGTTELHFLATSKVVLLDADDNACDPFNVPDGFWPTTIAIHLGNRIC